MAPSPKVVKAFMAMKSVGISVNKGKPVLKRLLKLHDRNWELIEEDNYRVLIDAIFEEEDDAKVSEVKDNASEGDVEEEAQVRDELKPPLKRLCLSNQDGESPLSLHDCDPRTPSKKQTASPSLLAGQGSSNPSDSCCVDKTLLMSKIDALNSENAVLEEKLRQAKEEGQKEKGELQLQISEAKSRAEQAEKDAEKARVQAEVIARENSELKARLCYDEESIIDKLLESERFQKIQEMTSIKLEIDVRKKIANSILNGI